MLPADMAMVRVPPEPLRSLAMASSPASCGPIAMPLDGLAPAAGFASAGLAGSAGLDAAGAAVAPAAGLVSAGLAAGACGAQATANRVKANSARLSRPEREITFNASSVPMAVQSA